MYRTTPYRLVIWDFDGTLANSLACGLSIYNQMAAKHGFKAIDDPESVRCLTTRSFIKQHRIPILKMPRLIKEYLQIQKGEMTGIRLYDDIPEVLVSIRERDVRQGIISSNSRENIHLTLDSNGVTDLFDFVIGYPRLFGKHRAIAKLMRQQRVAPHEVLYIGDEIRDIEAARKVAIDIASVTWGFNNEESLAHHQPNYLFSEPLQLLSCLSPTSVPT